MLAVLFQVLLRATCAATCAFDRLGIPVYVIDYDEALVTCRLSSCLLCKSSSRDTKMARFRQNWKDHYDLLQRDRSNVASIIITV
ncbi:hypothetical protein F5Y12DRAFT_734595 [Xylaria sp. FL1777]|nr:hypothetical protein F5Y12DRAFT_734595 [Xylaria sp. FL1777]